MRPDHKKPTMHNHPTTEEKNKKKSPTLIGSRNHKKSTNFRKLQNALPEARMLLFEMSTDFKCLDTESLPTPVHPPNRSYVARASLGCFRSDCCDRRLT